MPPRYAYWTIIVDDQATAFRAGALEDLMPTFNRLKEKQPSAKLMWFQSGKLWPSRIDAREAMQVRGERGKERDPRQRSNGDRSEGSSSFRKGRPAWKPKGSTDSGERPQWKPKGSSSAKPEGWGQHGARPEWKPKGLAESGGRAGWKPRSSGDSQPQAPSRRPEWTPKASKVGRPPQLAWKPKGASGEAPTEKRKWVPKADYQKAIGTEARRDGKWRPGGEHRDPRQKYKDAKKAKWTRFKQAIRTRATKKREGDK